MITFRLIFRYARRFGWLGISFASLLGLLTFFAVHLAGFLLLVPRSLHSFIDAYFLASFLGRLSLVLALCALIGRYSPYLVFSALLFARRILLFCRLSLSARERRAVIRKGQSGINDYLKVLKRAEEKGTFKHFPSAKRMLESRPARFYFGWSYFAGRQAGSLDFHVERLSLIIQAVSVFVALALIYASAEGLLILVVAIVFLTIVIPPTFGDFYFERPFFLFGLSPLSVLRFDPMRLMSIKKLVVVALTFALLLGVMHHMYLRSDRNQLRYGDAASRSISVIAKTSAGFIGHSGELGYFFIRDGARFEDAMFPWREH